MSITAVRVMVRGLIAVVDSRLIVRTVRGGASLGCADAVVDRAGGGSPVPGTTRNARPSDVGYAAFYCESCLRGLHLSRVVVPSGAVVRDGRLPIAERLPRIPDYVVVH